MTTETVRTNTPPTKLETAGSSNPPVCRQCALWKDPQSSLLWDLSSYPQIFLPATCDCGRTTQLSFFPFFFFFLAAQRGLWDLSFPTRDRTRAPRSESTEHYLLVGNSHHPTFTLSSPICPGEDYSLRGREKAQESGYKRALFSSLVPREQNTALKWPAS